MDGHLLRFQKKTKFCFTDIETYNLCLNMSYNCPWQVAIINYEGENRVNDHDIYLQWDNPEYLSIKPEIARMNHHSDDKIERLGIAPVDACKKIHAELKACDWIVGHNLLGFDIYLFRDMFNKFGLDWKFIMNKIIDTRAVAQGIKTEVPYDGKSNFLNYQLSMINKRVRGVKTNLKTLAIENDIDFDESKLHDALYDLEVNAAVWNKLKHQIEL